MTPTVGRLWSWVALLSVLLAGIAFGWALHGWDNPRVTSVRATGGRAVYAVRGGDLWYVYYSTDHSAPIAKSVVWTE